MTSHSAAFGGFNRQDVLDYFEKMAAEKNARYVEYISKMDASEILNGALDTLKKLRERGVKIALGSASKNSPIILKNVGLTEYFDEIVDGNSVSKAKPDPEVFTQGAERLGVAYEDCAVFEDSLAGLQAAKSVNMLAVGIGTRENLPVADVLYPSLKEFEVEKFF